MTSRFTAALLAATSLAWPAIAQTAPATGLVVEYIARVGQTDLTSEGSDGVAKVANPSNRLTWGVPSKGLPGSLRNPNLPLLLKAHGTIDAKPGQHLVVSARILPSQSKLPTVCAISATVGPDGSAPSISQSGIYIADVAPKVLVGQGVDADGPVQFSGTLNCYATDSTSKQFADSNNAFGEHNRFFGAGGNSAENIAIGKHFTPAEANGVAVEFLVGEKDDGSDAKPLVTTFSPDELKVNQVAAQPIPDGYAIGFVVDVLPYQHVPYLNFRTGWPKIDWQGQDKVATLFNRGTRTGVKFSLRGDAVAAKLDAKPYFMHPHSLFVPSEDGPWEFMVGVSPDGPQPHYMGCGAKATLQGFDTPLINAVVKVALDGTATFIGGTSKSLTAGAGAAWPFDLWFGCGFVIDASTQVTFGDNLLPGDQLASARIYVKGPSDLSFRDPKPGEFIEKIPEGAYVYGTAPPPAPVAAPPAAQVTVPVAAPPPAAPAPAAVDTTSAADIAAKLAQANAALDLTVGFKVGSADLDPQGRRQVAELGAALRTLGTAKVVLEGHTSPEGGDAINQPLSEKRAAAVASELKDIHSIDVGRLTSKGFGSGKPIAECATANTGDTCWTKDRRVTVRRIDG